MQYFNNNMSNENTFKPKKSNSNSSRLQILRTSKARGDLNVLESSEEVLRMIDYSNEESKRAHSVTSAIFLEHPDYVEYCPWCRVSECLCEPCAEKDITDKVCRVTCCFAYHQLFFFVTLSMALSIVWICIYVFAKESALPGGDIFALYALCIIAYFSGQILDLCSMPPSLGIFIMGVIFTNVGWFNKNHYHEFIPDFRSIVLTFIVLRCCLSLDPSVFKRRRGLISTMAIIPGFFEMMVSSVVSKYVMNMPWDWAFLLGCITTPLSSISTIHSLIILKEKGYGEDKGITSVLFMVDALDNVIMVTLFGVCFTIVFDFNRNSEQKYWLLLERTILAITIAIIAGFLLGVMVTYFPHRSDPYSSAWRTILISSSCISAVILTSEFKCDGVGYLFTSIAAITASIGWKAMGATVGTNYVNLAVSMTWHVLQPITLSLLGTEVNFRKMDPNNMTKASIVIICSISTRFILTFLVTGNNGFDWKERIFMAVICLPKGTPQVGLGPVPLDLAANDQEKIYSRHILNVALLAIFVTLIIGPIISMFLGERLLHKGTPLSGDISSGTIFSMDSKGRRRLYLNKVLDTELLYLVNAYRRRETIANTASSPV